MYHIKQIQFIYPVIKIYHLSLVPYCVMSYNYDIMII